MTALPSAITQTRFLRSRLSSEELSDLSTSVPLHPSGLA